VYTPTLTGLGERSHLLTPDVGLDTHILDVRQVLEFEDLQDVVLVGHSYAGMVITGVADIAAARLGQLIYVDAFLPENGKAATDYGRKVPPITADSWHDAPGTPESYGVTDERDINWMKTRLTDMPRKCLLQPVELSGKGVLPAQTTFILCTKASRFAESAERARQRGCRYRELLSGGHDVMITQPGQLAALLTELV